MFNEIKEKRQGYWAKKIIPKILKGNLNTVITNIVFNELLSHIEEGGTYGKFRYIYLGAVDSLEQISIVVTNIFPKLVEFFKTDDLKIKIHESCAVEKSTKVKVFSITFFHPDWNSNSLKNRPLELFRISYCTTDINSQKVINLLTSAIEKSIYSIGYYPNEIEVKLK